MSQAEEVRAYWESRATLGIEAGSQDVIAKKLEVSAIADYVSDGMDVLDVGCGNGVTALELARRYRINIVGVDYTPKMISAASEACAQAGLQQQATFRVANVLDLPLDLGTYDLIYGERVLINLPDWKTQQSALKGIARRLKSGGNYVMCECSQNGLDKINELRKRVGLTTITPPWHNRYLRDEEVAAARLDDLVLSETRDFSSTYYFLSRVVNAWLAQQEGLEPSYDAPVNQLATRLPSVGEMGQTKIWLWRKT